MLARMLLQKIPQLTGPATWSLVRLTGAHRADGSDLSALYFGNGSNLSYLRNLLFATADAEEIDRPASAHSLVRQLARRRKETQVVLAELPPLWSRLLRLPGPIFIPAWVRHEIDLSTSATAERVLPRHVEREADRQVRRHAYTVRFATDMPTFRWFFHEMYSPYVRSRFGDAAQLNSEDVFLSRCAGQTLAILETGGAAVAAVLLKRDRDTLRLGWYGCAQSPPPQGASEALDVLCIRHAYQEGVRRIVLGDSRPSLADGVVRYKMKFGARIHPTVFPQPRLAIAPTTWTPALVDQLNQWQLVSIRSGRPEVVKIDTATLQVGYEAI